MASTGTILVADCFDTYSLTLPLFQTPSPYVMAAASFQNWNGGALVDSTHNVFSTVSVPAVGGVPWNTFGSNHYINADCTQVGTPNPFPNPGPGIYRTFGNVYQSIVFGQWIRVNALPGFPRSVALWRLCDGQNHTGGLNPQIYGLAHCFLSLSFSGILSLINGGGSTGTIGTAIPNFPVGSWHFLETFIYLGDKNSPTQATQGNFTVKLDGAVLFKSDNAQTAFFDFQGAGYNADTITIDAEFDNVANIDFGPYYVMSAPNAGAMLGTSTGVMFQTLFANANGSVNQLVVTGAATNFQAINGTVPNPAVYVSTATAGQRDQYKFPAFSGFSSLFAVCPIIVAESDGPGTRVVTSVQQTAGEITRGAFGLTNGTYNYYETVFTGVTPAQAATGQWGEELLN